MCFRGCGVLIFSGETERSGSYRIDPPCSNPLHGYDFLFPYFLCYHKSCDSVSEINDNSKFNAN